MAEKMIMNAFNEVLGEEMKKDKDIIFVAESVKGTVFGLGGMLALPEEVHDRVIDAPISEAGFAAACVGAAVAGKHPVCDLMFADFTSLAYQAIVMEAAKLRFVTNNQAEVPVVFLACQGQGISGGLHHSNNVEGWFMQAPGLVVMTPSTAADTAGLFRAALHQKNPVLFLLHKTQLAAKGEVPDDYVVPIGKADVVQEGTDVTVIASQYMRAYAEKAIKKVEKDGISVELIDPRTILPYDREAFAASAKKTGRVLILQESPLTGGPAAEFSAAITEDCFAELKKPVARLGGANTSIPYGLGSEAAVMPSVADIEAAIRDLVK